MNTWVGNDIGEIIELWGPPDETIRTNEGQQEYKYNLEDLDPSCIHYWIVNSQGTITGFHYKGRCRPIG